MKTEDNLKGRTHEHKKIKIKDREADGYVIPLGPVNLVFAVTGKGLVGCGAFNVNALDKYGYPACKAKARDGSGISTLDDLLRAEIDQSNEACSKSGIKPGMTVLEAIEKLI
jgi:uncharacterized protein YunC (DUF1805 family)